MNEFRNFQFIELSASLAAESQIDGMAFGIFTDGSTGSKVTLDKRDLAAFIEKTQEAIDRTMSKSGELVGLPVDLRNHDKGDAAGWIVGVEKGFNEFAGEIVRLLVRWTDLGIESISKNIRRFFSPTVDITNTTILGGSLTNWTATVNEDGQRLLGPIELSSKIHTYEVEPKMSDKTKVVEEVVVATPDDVQPEPATEVDMAELAKKAHDKIYAELTVEFDKKLDAQLATIRRESDVAEFSQGLFDGGFPTPADDLETFLGSLNEKQYEAAKVILGNVAEHGITDFGEAGHGKSHDQSVELEEKIGKVLENFLAENETNTIDEFFAANTDLGDKAKFNLSKYQEAK